MMSKLALTRYYSIVLISCIFLTRFRRRSWEANSVMLVEREMPRQWIKHCARSRTPKVLSSPNLAQPLLSCHLNQKQRVLDALADLDALLPQQEAAARDLVHKPRDDTKKSKLDALNKQIAKDLDVVNSELAAHGPSRASADEPDQMRKKTQKGLYLAPSASRYMLIQMQPQALSLNWSLQRQLVTRAQWIKHCVT